MTTYQTHAHNATITGRRQDTQADEIHQPGQQVRKPAAANYLDQIKELRIELWFVDEYRPVAICNWDTDRAPGKRPVGPAWHLRARRTPPEAAFAPVVPHAMNTGILADGLRAVDIDIDDGETARALTRLAVRTFGPTIVRSRSNSSRVLLLYRAAEGEPPKRRLSGALGKVEILGYGQQFVAFGTHASGVPLEWREGSPLTVARDELPTITEGQISAYFEQARALLGDATEAVSASGAADRSSAHGLVGDLADVASAVAVIPNNGPADWDAWTRVGMAIWGATDGSDEGLDLFHAYSEQHPSYDPDLTTARWQAITGSPPDQIGAGTLLYLAKQADPAWRRPSAGVTDGSEFDGLPPDEPARPAREVFEFRPFVWRAPHEIEPREWLYGGHYIRRYLGATFAPGGLGKSSMALVEALDMVTGRGLLTGRPTDKRLTVWYFCGEDPLQEIERRVVAACHHYGISEADIGGRLFLNSGRDFSVCLATEDRNGMTIAVPTVDKLVSEATTKRCDVLILDPFVSVHKVSENDNAKIDAVAKQFAAVADRANCFVELIHHVRKSASGSGGQDRTADDGRGAAALKDAARSVRVLNPMQADEADKLGIPADERWRYFRTDAGKANMAPAGAPGVWRRLASVNLGNARPDRGLASDDVGVVSAWEKPAADEGLTPDIVATVRARLRGGDPLFRRDVRSPDWIGKMIAELLGIATDSKGGRARVVAMVDLMIANKALACETRNNGKARAIECLVAPDHYVPQSVGL